MRRPGREGRPADAVPAISRANSAASTAGRSIDPRAGGASPGGAEVSFRFLPRSARSRQQHGSAAPVASAGRPQHDSANNYGRECNETRRGTIGMRRGDGADHNVCVSRSGALGRLLGIGAVGDRGQGCWRVCGRGARHRPSNRPSLDRRQGSTACGCRTPSARRH